MKWAVLRQPDVVYNGGYAIGLSEFAKIVAEFAISKIFQLQGALLWSFFITFVAINMCALKNKLNYMMKQIFSNLKTVSKTTIFMLALLCAVVQGAWADAGDTTIPFHVVDIYPVTSKSTTLSASEYIVNSDVTVSSRITISGNVVLNLGEGKTLTASKGIELSEGNSLTINGPGALTIDDCEEYDSGIGAKRVGTLTINGGTINVTGGYLAASIGGSSRNEVGGTITINGGVVNATGGQSAAGIGGGRRGSSWGDTTKGQGYTTTAGGATAGGDGKVIITWYGTTHP